MPRAAPDRVPDPSGRAPVRPIPTSLHGAVDYAWGAALLAAPVALGFGRDRAADRLARAAGLGAILYAVLTDYELGAVPLIPMETHLRLDVAGGLALAAPALLGGRRETWGPHLAFGLVAIAAGLLTRRAPRAR